MKRKQSLLVLLTVCFFVCAALLITACDSTPTTTATTTTSATTDDGKLLYTVKVADYNGQIPTSSVLIDLMKDGVSLGMKKTDANGEVAFLLEKGSYTFVPTPDEGEYYYDSEACVLSEEAPTATVTLYNLSSEKRTIYPYFSDANDFVPYEATVVGEGATYVEIDRPEMSYYVFTPTRGGLYKITYLSESALTLGYFGDANVVLKESAAKVENRAFELEIQNSSIGTGNGGTLSVVIGLKSLKEKDAFLVIERTADATKPLEWDNLTAKELPESIIRTDYLNHTLVDVSVCDPSVKLEYSEDDGYYHYGSVDGPLVFLRIASASPYLASFQTVCETTRMGCQFYDENGQMIKKESYNDIINAYAALCDSNGVTPLTQELVYVVQKTGEHMKWWDFSASGNNIFSTDTEGNELPLNRENVVQGNEWMFACCYVEEFVYGSQETPIPLTTDAEAIYAVIAQKEKPLYFGTSKKATLKIENAEGLTVLYNDTLYTAENGVLTVDLLPQTDTELLSFTLLYNGEKEKAEISFTFVDYIAE